MSPTYIKGLLPLALAIAALFFGSCTSTVMACFDALDPANPGLFVDRGISLGNDGWDFVLHPATNRQGEHFLFVECRRLAGTVLVAPITLADSDRLFKQSPVGEIQLDLAWLYQFYNWEFGWSEFQQQLTGKLQLQATKDGWQLSVGKEAELLDFSSAAVKLGDKIIRGDQALTIMRNRAARVDAIVAFINQRTLPAFDPTIEAWSQRKSWYVPAFKEMTRDILVPELSPAERRPKEWRGDAKKWDYAESIWWNREYSERLFPANLVEIRQSGTLVRDWEESLAMIYGRWRWPASLALLIDGIEIHPVK